MKYALHSIHNAKFPLVEIDVSVNQILNVFPLGTVRSLKCCITDLIDEHMDFDQ